MLLRLVWRLSHRHPDLPAGTGGFTRVASSVVHGFLYVLMLGMPLSGYIDSIAGHHPFRWFGLFPVPELVPYDKTLSAVGERAHMLGAYAVYALVGLHIAAAVWHALRRDGIMGRMQYGGGFTGNNIADFDSDQVYYAGISGNVGRTGQRQYRDAGFIQDDWRPTDHLTVNLGLRYEYDQPIYEVNDKQANVDLATGQSQQISETKDDESPAFSPNGRLIVYATRAGGKEVLMTTTLDGKIKTPLLVTLAEVREPTWGPFTRP